VELIELTMSQEHTRKPPWLAQMQLLKCKTNTQVKDRSRTIKYIPVTDVHSSTSDGFVV